VLGALRRSGKFGNFSLEPGDSAAYSGDYSEDFLQKVHILADYGEKITTRPVK
jgi:hypothetical protein